MQWPILRYFPTAIVTEQVTDEIRRLQFFLISFLGKKTTAKNYFAIIIITCVSKIHLD